MAEIKFTVLELTEEQQLSIDIEARKSFKEPGQAMLFGGIFRGRFEERSKLFLHAVIVDKKSATKICKAIKESQERNPKDVSESNTQTSLP